LHFETDRYPFAEWNGNKWHYYYSRKEIITDISKL
jgi:hypothetical protein